MRDADLVLRNGNLLTFDRSSRIASSVAIANGRICMVGSDDEIARNCPNLYAKPGARPHRCGERLHHTDPYARHSRRPKSDSQ